MDFVPFCMKLLTIFYATIKILFLNKYFQSFFFMFNFYHFLYLASNDLEGKFNMII